ncbi:F-box/LRR-repeat protein At4g29420 [Diospyros lotus]|uniref:F-box/LRR-repeat protein At4g29420 n=1 Tax=Diospyros lotus TaxID=55363 RepID=UPI00224DB48B|nr:F-box/LRR-repeat protein At4g29420 [Diospyros lotus]
MDDLPSPLILEILSRLHDSADLARCRLVSREFNALSSDVRTINFHCSLERYTMSRSPATRSDVTPFKTIFKRLVSSLRRVESISIGVEKPLREMSYDDVEDESDDLYLTDKCFISDWLPSVAGELKSISISDFWIQSCWRQSVVLSLISCDCLSLRELELKNCWLSVDGLNPMPMLTSLTLEYVRLDDENLGRVNDCFPSLQVLNLIGVGGLGRPKIHLLHLRTCQWTVSNAPLSLTILAPNLINLKLACVKPRSLVIDAPLLTDFNLSIETASKFQVKEPCNLKALQLESKYLCSLFNLFTFGRTIKNLIVDSSKCDESGEVAELNLAKLFNVFSSTTSLTLGPGAWSKAETWFLKQGSEVIGGTKELKELIARFYVDDINITLLFIFYLLEKCTSLRDMTLLIHHEVETSIASSIMSRSMAHCARVRWRWGLWMKGKKDAWISDGI